MQVLSLKMYTDYAPTQMEGRTDDNRPVYVRYREGWLSIEIGLPGEENDSIIDGYTVYEDEMISESGSEESITVSEIENILRTVDLSKKLQELELQEYKFRQIWNEVFEDAEEYEIEGIRILKLSLLGEVPWETPYMNRIGRYDFELDFSTKLDSGVFVYFHTAEPENRPSITLFVSGNLQYLKPLKLV